MAAPAQASSSSGDADDRHRQMQERFRAQQEARLQARQASRAESDAHKDPKESAGLFWGQLRATHDEVTRALDGIAQQYQEAAEGPGGGGSAENAQEALAKMTTKIDALEQRTTAAVLFLPPYDVRRAQEEIQGLRSKLEATRLALAPRKKFSFSARRRQQREQQEQGGGGNGSEAETKGVATPPSPALAGLSLVAEAAAVGVAAAAAPAATTAAAAAPAAMEGFEGREGEELDLRAAYGADPPKDLLLKDLRQCTVRLLAPLSFLRMEGLRDCRVVCGPVAGPVYLEDCRGCTLHLASRQLRIHTTEACDLYVHTVSGPIIEDCDALRFAPYALRYAGLDGDMAAAQLTETRNAWGEVKDFKWLRAQQSPHWSVLPEGERRAEEAAEAVVGGGGDDGGEEEEEEIKVGGDGV